MNIICDTNIWYDLGKKILIPNNGKNNLIATFISIDELSKSYNFIRNPKIVINAINAIANYSNISKTIYDPPFIYLKKLSCPNYKYDTFTKHNVTIKIFDEIAKGLPFNKSDKDVYFDYCNTRELHIKDLAELFNQEALKIKNKIKNKNKHRAENTLKLNREFISFMVSVISKSNGLCPNFDWSQIELFENVLKIYLNDLELGARKMHVNDIYDLFLLIYIKPGDKLWTKEKLWIDYISKRLDMGHYLYNE